MLNSKVPRYYIKDYADKFKTSVIYYYVLKNVLKINEDVVQKLYNQYEVKEINKILRKSHHIFFCKGQKTTHKIGFFIELYNKTKDKKQFFDNFDNQITYSVKTYTTDFVNYKIGVFEFMNEKNQLKFLESIYYEKDMQTFRRLTENKNNKYDKILENYQKTIKSYMLLLKLQ
jgi:hypothetical protein